MKKTLHIACHIKAHHGHNNNDYLFQHSPDQQSSDESIASSFVVHDPPVEKKIVKQRSFGFGRSSQAPSQVSVNLDPERTSIASQEDFAVRKHKQLK